MRSLLAPLAVLVAGCAVPDDEVELPPLRWQGERVRVGTTLVSQVCQGTLDDLDAHLASVEFELGLEPEGIVEIYVLDDETFGALCVDDALACTRGAQVFFSVAGYRYRRHELVHARLIGIAGLDSIPLFDEGIAAAMDRDGGCRAIPACDALTIDDLLNATTSNELFELEGYTAASDLVHGMLDRYGAPAVLAFMAEAPAGSTSETVRATYLEHFGATIEDDFSAFKRDRFDAFTLAQQGCEPLTQVDLMNGSLDTLMDCSSPGVINDFSDPTRGRMELGFRVDDMFAGSVDPTWSATDGSPEIRRCAPARFSVEDLADLGPWSLDWTLEDRALLGPGLHTLVWEAQMGAELSVSMSSSCVHEMQDCPTGEQCDVWNTCYPLGSEVAGLGEPCVEDFSAATCEAGARCLGGICVAECDSTLACVGEDACARIGVCGPVCDLLDQDCLPGYACTPSPEAELLEVGAGVCVPEGPGLFESCNAQLEGCAAGLTCERHGFCHPSQDSGCCVELCEVGTSSPGCPFCEPIAGSDVGFCSAA